MPPSIKHREASRAFASGRQRAEQLCSHLEKVRAGGDVQGAPQFEAELLPIAKTKFEWLSPVEFTDLDRLKTDRNRCAHPSLVEEGLAYAPSAELARVHLKNAVTSVLQHPPAQGKYALDRLMRDVTLCATPDRGSGLRAEA